MRLAFAEQFSHILLLEERLSLLHWAYLWRMQAGHHLR